VWTNIPNAVYAASSSIWSRPLVDLSAYAGQIVRISFLSKYGNPGVAAGWYIDDVSVIKM
jgi:hypothetical protein